MDAARLDVEVLRRGLQGQGLSVAGLARALGVSYSTAHRWVMGEVVPRPSLFVRLADVLGVEPGALLGVGSGGPSLVQARFMAGLATPEAAARAGLAMMTYNRIERGHARRVAPEVVGRIAGALAIDPQVVEQAVAGGGGDG